MAQGPNPVYHLFLSVKFYWNTGPPICLHIVCGCFPATKQVGKPQELRQTYGLKYLLSDPLRKFANHYSRSRSSKNHGILELFSPWDLGPFPPYHAERAHLGKTPTLREVG